MKKVIIFDFWGTLVEQGVTSPIKQMKRMLGLEEMDYPSFVVQLEQVMMTRSFESLGEACELVCDAFSVEKKPALIESMIGMWNKNWLLARPYDETKEMLEHFKKDYRLVLLANTDNFSVDRVLDKFELRELFDELFLSYKEGMIKTDSRTYQLLMKKMHVTPKDCLAVGDSIESDMAAAHNASVKGVLIDRRNMREFEPKITTLKELTWN
ncbi:MAG TPA: HAD family hydrolase [Candidatus Nanoarchaeia archaeon]|nr:HAD family hydrolase [Candidatus Nanoarchaeia archaeon]